MFSDSVPTQPRYSKRIYEAIHTFSECIENVYVEAATKGAGKHFVATASQLLGTKWHVVVDDAKNHHPVPWAELPSFIYANSTMKLGDAGIDFNIPILPLLSKQRTVGISNMK